MFGIRLEGFENVQDKVTRLRPRSSGCLVVEVIIYLTRYNDYEMDIIREVQQLLQLSLISHLSSVLILSVIISLGMSLEKPILDHGNVQNPPAWEQAGPNSGNGGYSLNRAVAYKGMRLQATTLSNEKHPRPVIVPASPHVGGFCMSPWQVIGVHSGQERPKAVMTSAHGWI